MISIFWHFYTHNKSNLNHVTVQGRQTTPCSCQVHFSTTFISFFCKYTRNVYKSTV